MLSSFGFPFLFALWCISSFVAFAIKEETNSLLKWKFSLSIESSQSKLSSWTLDPADENATNSKSNSDPCNWEGISCNSERRVVRIELRFLGLQGTLEEFPFSSLPNLTHIDFSGNTFYGILPSRISNLSNLVYLNLYNNLLNGTIPPEIGLLQHLEVLSLSLNYFVGSIPFTFANLKKLTYFSVSSNYLSGPIPSELENMTFLKHLHLQHNHFNGSIPVSIGNLKNLVQLFLHLNQLSGPIPGSVANLVNLHQLSLGSNNLSGNLEMDMFTNLKNLESLYLSYNSLSLKIGINANFTLPRLRALGLSSCDLNQFPEFIKESNDLTTLDLSNNKIEGPIPEWMQDIGQNTLTDVNLSNNSLTGGLELLAWKKIRYVDVRSNKFQGKLPTLLDGTIFYSISNKSFTGEIPSENCNANTLAVIHLSQNNINRKIPPNCLFEWSNETFNSTSRACTRETCERGMYDGSVGCYMVNLD